MVLTPSPSDKKTILLAAGGTGGHVFPALALADTLHAQGVHVLFATDDRGVRYVKNRPWLNLAIIRAGTIRKHPIRLVKDMIHVIYGMLQSFDLIRSYAPDVVVGFGGYPCFPPVFAAQILGIPTLLHEQNAVIGKANAGLARLCTQLALSFPDYTGIGDHTRKKTVVTGNPVRPDIAALSQTPYTLPDADQPLNVLIVGGSQGAQVFARLIPEVMKRMSSQERSTLHLIQQVQDSDLDRVRAQYAELGVNAETAPFFNDMTKEWGRAHLFIGRSGASTVAEATAVGCPSIFIPYPHHKDQQQLKNALNVTKVHGARVIEEKNLTPESLLADLRYFMQNPQQLAIMADAARACGHPQAAEALADAALSLIA